MIPIILASDKTPVTRHTGGLQMHPVFLTIGNIQSDIRMQASSHAWRCIAFIPLPTIKVHSKCKTLLSSRLFHWSLDVVTARLKEAVKNGHMLVDASGNIRRCFTPLVSYIADLPEQQLIAGVSKNASPVTMAELPSFGNATPAEPRTRDATLRQLRELCERVDPWDLEAFQTAAKAMKLLGVHLPFWRDWMFAEPSLFLTGEILHTLHKFFYDHVLEWCKVVAGSHTLDTRFMNLHQRVSFRHFATGVAHRPQASGRDHRDMERQLVPVLDGAGAVTDDFIRTVQSMVEFIYRAQDPVYTDSSITVMEQALANFHSRKQCIIDLGARRGTKAPIKHFNIPKLELMSSFARQTKANGALIQYTADVSERLLITHCKTTFQRTSRSARTFTDEIVEILNREETMRLFDLYLVLRMADSSAIETVIRAEHEETTTIDPTLEFVQQVLPEQEAMFHGPRRIRNHFQNPNSMISSDGEIALHVTVRPDQNAISVTQMQILYRLPDLPFVISRYIQEFSEEEGQHTRGWDIDGNVSMWNKFRIQLHSSFRGRYVDKSQVIQAYPPSEEYPLGHCDAVLLRHGDGDQYGMNHVVTFFGFNFIYVFLDIAQVRAVFKPKSKEILPPYLAAAPLCYVRYFRPLPLSVGRESVGLYQVERMDPLIAPPTGIIPLTHVVRLLDLIPVFDTAFSDIPPSSKTCMEGYARYYLNTFSDKDTFHALHH